MVELTIKRALEFAVKNHAAGKLQEAEVVYRKILDRNPNHPDALHLLGVIAHQVGKHEDAINYISRAIQLNSNSAIYYSNLGMAYDKLGKEEESTINFKKALKIDPKYDKAHLAHYNLGVFYMNRGQTEEALEHYDKALESDKDFYEALWNRSLILLLLGRFKEGWDNYEYRFKKEKPSDSRVFDKPKWDGSSLIGKRILILLEQGFGDGIHFIRYVPLVKEKGGQVILECKRELIRLFADFPGVDQFVEKEKDIVPDVKFDTYIHSMSLPRIFNTNFDNIPNKIPYLKADSSLIENFKAEFNTKNFKVGIVWAGNPSQSNDKNRSARYEKFKFLKEIPGVKLFSLQKGEASRQLNDLEVINLGDKLNDFADTAAVIKNLDLIISVDTSVAHLAGAMDKPVWTLLTFGADWRWLVKREYSPWYPSMKLFRQQKLGDWDSVFDRVKDELKGFLSRRGFK